MDKHITDIETFEFVNNLLTDQSQIALLEDHIATCRDCAVKIEAEKKVTHVLRSDLSVMETIDVSEQVMNHFSEKPMLFKVYDNNWTIYSILASIGVLCLVQLFKNPFIQEVDKVDNLDLSYITISVLAIVCLLSLDLLYKHFKQKKQQVIS